MLAKFICVLPFLFLIKAQFCVAKCKSSDTTSCVSSGPTSCSKCASLFYTNDDCSSLTSGTSLVEYEATTSIPALWNISGANPGMTCNAQFTSPSWTYTYEFYNKLVGWDYLYRNIPITAPHYKIKYRFSIAYIGVWSATNRIWMHTNDGIQTYDRYLDYSCVPGSSTGFLCDLATAQNHVDCLQNYQNTTNHNTTTMLFNFTYISDQKDSSVQFWNLFDFLIVTVNCDLSCATCYSSTATSCYSCANGYYLSPNNTCTKTCIGSLYILPSKQNPQTGECVSACPQGYYLSALTCLPCSTGCLICSSGTFCNLYEPGSSSSLWSQYMALWIVIILLGIFVIAAACWRLLFYSKPIHSEELKIVPDQRTYEDKITINNETGTAKENQANFHIEDIDYRDNVMIDQNPRKRKRMEKDLFRTNSDF